MSKIESFGGTYKMCTANLVIKSRIKYKHVNVCSDPSLSIPPKANFGGKRKKINMGSTLLTSPTLSLQK